ncbi:hypothetical protein B0H11DRAFT_2049083 [Mycena galericulata]|nr:hypothetical protein B0H11DRAFT_2049083 [Mycena galericulata]
MSNPLTPNTARPIYATGTYYDDNLPTPRPSRYNRQLIPPNPTINATWKSLPNSNRQPHPLLLQTDPDARIVWETTGKRGTYDSGVLLNVLNARADEFRPSGMVYSASSSSSSSATSSSGRSSATSATPAPSPIPVFPNVEPEEHVYRFYRARLRTATDVSAAITDIVAAGVLSYEKTQHMAIFADRLSAHAPCGTQQFKALLRDVALGMFYSYWHGDSAPWRSEPPLPHQYLTSKGVNIAAFIGSLYRYQLIDGNDAHHCLDVLLCTERHFLKLQAAHALIVHCGSRICAGEDNAQTIVVRTRLAGCCPEGYSVWGSDPVSHALLIDLLENLDLWFGSYEMSQIHARAAALSPPSATERGRSSTRHM